MADHHTYFVGLPEWGFGVWAYNANYAVLPHPSGTGWALAEKQADGSFVFVAERNTANVRVFAQEADAVAAISSGGGSRITAPSSTPHLPSVLDYSQMPTKGNQLGLPGLEGTVYEIPGHPDWVVKEFHPRTVATQASNEAQRLADLEKVFGSDHVVKAIQPPRRIPGQPVFLIKERVLIVAGGEDWAAKAAIEQILKTRGMLDDVGRNLVWGHTGDGKFRWIWIE